MSPSSHSYPHIPFEIISTEILHRLDLKTLTLSTSVSKQWNSLITTPSFVTYHFLSNTGKIPESLFFHICLTQTDSLLKRLFHFQETYYINNNNNSSSLVPPLTPFPSPPLDRFKNKDSFLSVVGICNGLVCVVDDNLFSYILWNPSVRKYVLLPRLEQCLERKACLGFGFVNDDFKVVKLVNENAFLQEAWVCSFNSRSWKSVLNNNNNNDDDDGNVHDVARLCYVCEDRSYVFLNGKLHWIAKHQIGGYYNCVLTFDLAEEVFGELLLPEKLRVRCTMSSLSLFEVRGCLAVSRIQDEIIPAPIVRVWVMEEYGVVESWTKIVKVQHKELIPKNVLVLTKDGGEMVIEQRGGQIVKFNPTTSTMEYLGVGGDKVFVGYLGKTLFLLGKGKKDGVMSYGY